MCVLFFSINLTAKFLILRITVRSMMKNVYLPSCKVPVILVRFQWNLDFSTVFFLERTLKYQIALKSVQWEPSWSLQMDGQRDRRTYLNY